MKPLKLTLQAFGPYAGKEVIDFTKLENRTMFVVSGKTGSGKTTIFDGISYAIYGKASGEDRSGPDLRSQFAKDELLTEVSLDFSLRQKSYRITRSPQQEKKKERGDGYTTVGAKAELYQLEEDGTIKLLAANVRDVDEKIKEIMIIDSNQFRQILMIPQGEFRKLLTSDSKEKEVILQRLFHTEMYKKIEEKLKEEATELKKHVQSQTDERSAILKRAHAFENEALKEYLDAGSDHDAILIPLIQDEIVVMQQKLMTLKEAQTEKQKERDLLQQKLFEAETILKQLNTLAALHEKKQKLERQIPTFEEKEKEAQLAKKAAFLESQEALCHRLKKDVDQLTVFIEESTKKIKHHSELLEQAERELTKQNAREDERKQTVDAVNKLDHIKEDVKAFAGLKLETETILQTLSTTKKKNEQFEAEGQNIELKVNNLKKEKETIDQAQLSFIEGERKLEKLEFHLDKLLKYENQQKQKDQAILKYEQRKQEYENAEARFLDTKELLKEIEQTWLHSQAAIIASTLTDEKACPVCGSEHHPSPAIAENGFVPTEQDLNAAREQVGQVEKEKAKLEKVFLESEMALNTIIQNSKELQLELSQKIPDFDPYQVQHYISNLEAEQAKLILEQKQISKKIDRLAFVRQELEELEKNKVKVQENIKLLGNKLQQLTIAYTEKKTNLSRMTETIPEELRSWQAFEQQYKLALKRQEQLILELESAQKSYQEAKDVLDKEKTRLEEGEKRLNETKEKLTEEREIFKTNMIKQGFEIYQQYHNAKRPENVIERLETETRQFREELRSVSDRLEETSEVLKDVQRPDVELLRESLADLDQVIGKVSEDYQNLYLKKHENEQIVDSVQKINECIKTLEKRYNLIGHLYEISKGQNTYRITFERFVLAAFLDDILAEANVRLGKMTSGRYRLHRKTDRSKGNVQSGLELLVFDQYTGQERHVKTLSGGESFKAALSLALGLADVVQNYAGGVSLETMFIDEGFGTLDPESLDQAIEALIEIQSSGRLVGIISHVPELKERIDARLEVIATQVGSKTEFHFSV
ncbi:AAA family ATPase [Mesobacillus maritimus]|uniref:AAA family ATPase n=1 Tax=Mesobacillus maritimus TaxID=1643336 RepID=UPI00203AEFEF|nr:AAA family ATPase [Mesobacillus maritimus]MCM3585976.1 AAA family ATPase [Mesobacillus maritimus]